MSILETRPLNAQIWQREPEEHLPVRSMDIGTAGEHIVCADLILKGHRAFLSSAGMPYDLIVDINGTLLRITVKSASKITQRPPREGNRVCYSFVVTRPRRLSSGKTDARAYTAADVDIVAFCALDKRQVAYCHLSECATTMHFDPIGSPVLEMYKGKIPGRDRKAFETYTFARALEIQLGQRAPSILKRGAQWMR